MSGEIKTTLKTMGFCGPCTASDTAEIDVRDGKILRTCQERVTFFHLST